MPSFHSLRVVEIIAERTGLQRVRLDDGSRAFVLTRLVGTVAPGDDVVVNTTAVDLGLGTGGWHVVHWNLARRDLVQPGPGHIMKLRYTSLQVDTGAAEEHQEDGSADTTADVVDDRLPDLRGIPVLVGSLHSQLGVALAIVRQQRPDLRTVYVMTDGAALPLALSDLVAAASDAGLLAGTITAGHAFGGDLEAVSVPSALHLAVDRLRADLVVCAMGPGVVGTASTLGTTATETAAVASAVVALGGRPVWMARASDGDLRPRHLGLSHHTVTSLRLTPTPVDVPVPFGSGLGERVPRPHRVVEIDVDAALGPAGGIAEVLHRAGLTVTTMGRGPDDDPLFFRTVAAATLHALAPAVPRPVADGTVGRA